MKATTKNTSRTFCESFAWCEDWTKPGSTGPALVWYDTAGLYRSGLNGHIVVKIELGGGDHLDRFRVKVMNKLEGEIDAHEFRFTDFLALEGAIDVRNGGKGAPGHPMPEATFNGWRGRDGLLHWYLIKPKDTRPLCAAIENYVATFER